MLVCAICFGLFSVAVSKSKTYRENRAILRALGVKPASYASCEDVVERETRGMTFYATDLFGWSPFPVETRFDAASYRRRNLKYSLSRSSSSAAESAAPSEEENEEDVPVAVASPKEIENEVGGTDTSEDERGERQQQQLVVTKEDGNEEEKTKEAATTTTETETETTDDDNEQDNNKDNKNKSKKPLSLSCDKNEHFKCSDTSNETISLPSLNSTCTVFTVCTDGSTSSR